MCNVSKNVSNRTNDWQGRPVGVWLFWVQVENFSTKTYSKLKVYFGLNYYMMSGLAMKCIILMIICLNAADEHGFFGGKSQHQLFCTCKITTSRTSTWYIEYIKHLYSFLMSAITFYEHAEKLGKTIFVLYEINIKFGKFS